MICPIGGESFQALVFSHYSTFGMRPDGKPNASWLMPLPIPECPSNGLVLLRDFDAATVAKLKPLIASPEYRAMTKGDSTYYRAQWLATRIGMTEVEALGLLLPATWQVKPATAPTGQAMPSPEKAIAYQAEFARRVGALPDTTSAEDRLWLQARAANALREIGRFDEAEAMRQRAVTALPASDAKYWAEYLAQLKGAIDRRDTGAEPLDMVGDIVAVGRCVDLATDASAFDQSWCAAPERQARIAERRAMIEKFKPKAP